MDERNDLERSPSAFRRCASISGTDDFTIAVMPSSNHGLMVVPGPAADVGAPERFAHEFTLVARWIVDRFVR